MDFHWTRARVVHTFSLIRRTEAILLLSIAYIGYFLPEKMPMMSFFLAGIALIWLALDGLFNQPKTPLWVHITIDLTALTVALALTGGSSNPLTILYWLPVVGAALSGSMAMAAMASIAASAAYGILFFWHQPLPWVTENPQVLWRIHLLGMWLSFVFSAIFSSLWLAHLVSSLRAQEIGLNQAQEKQQQGEYWLDLGMRAAHLAHQFSTPLNNLFLLHEEWQNLPEQYRHDWLIQGEQLRECREILNQLKAPTREPRTVCPEDELERRLFSWHTLRADAHCTWQKPSVPPISVVLDESFWSAFLNILNNAADAGDGSVELSTERTADHFWQLTVRNRQGCLSDEQLARAGLNTLDSGKRAGLGLGLRLSYAALKRLGGSLTLDNQPQGGVRAIIKIPLITQ